MIALCIFGVIIGVVMIVGAIFDWDFWLMPESTLIEMIGGRTVMRWFWGIMGGVWILAALGCWLYDWKLIDWL
jgi:hypothetical protein